MPEPVAAPTEPVAASAIVLAGGRSARFGAEKLAVEVGGAPLLHHAVRAAAGVCDEVLVVGPPRGLPVDLPADLPAEPLIVADVAAYQGPLVALVDAAKLARHDRLLLLAGDMPALVPAVLRRLLAWADGTEGACLIADGWVQTLPMGLDRPATVVRGAGLVEAGQRSLRALIDALVVELVLEDEWRTLDPAGRTLRDVDRPGDAE